VCEVPWRTQRKEVLHHLLRASFSRGDIDSLGQESEIIRERKTGKEVRQKVRCYLPCALLNHTQRFCCPPANRRGAGKSTGSKGIQLSFLHARRKLLASQKGRRRKNPSAGRREKARKMSFCANTILKGEIFWTNSWEKGSYAERSGEPTHRT